MRHAAIAVLLFALSATSPAQVTGADTARYAQLVEAAMARLHATDWSVWAYTETAIESDGVFVGRFDPRQPAGERWSLTSVNNRAPTAAEVETYLDEKSGDGGWGDDQEGDSVVDMVTPEGLELVEETDDHYLFRFQPDEDELEEGFGQFLEATLRISRLGDPWLEYIDVHNNGPFSPELGVRVRDFAMRMTFGPATDEGPIVPRSLEVKVSIRALFVFRFDEHIVNSYSEYRRVTD